MHHVIPGEEEAVLALCHISRMVFSSLLLVVAPHLQSSQLCYTLSHLHQRSLLLMSAENVSSRWTSLCLWKVLYVWTQHHVAASSTLCSVKQYLRLSRRKSDCSMFLLESNHFKVTLAHSAFFFIRNLIPSPNVWVQILALYDMNLTRPSSWINQCEVCLIRMYVWMDG